MTVCAGCGERVDHDRHRFYEPDDAGRERLVATFCDVCCPRCFRRERKVGVWA